MEQPESPADPEDNPFPRVVDRWERVVEDMHATAAEYREAGREVVDLHPGDIHVVDPADVETDEYDLNAGLDVIVPGDEYAALRELVADRTFGEYELLRAVANDIVFCVIVLEADDGEAAVLVPAYYEGSEMAPLRGRERLYTQVRPLESEQVVTFTHEEPDPFFPGA